MERLDARTGNLLACQLVTLPAIEVQEIEKFFWRQAAFRFRRDVLANGLNVLGLFTVGYNVHCTD